MEKLLTVAEVAEFLAISKSLVYELVDRGEIAYIPVGRKNDIDLNDRISKRLYGREKHKFKKRDPPSHDVV